MLPIGNYVLVEVAPPDGYVTAEEVPFTVKDTGEVQTVEMPDDVTKVVVSKKDFTTKGELPGANLEIWTVDENGDKAELVEEWVSESEAHYIEGMGIYGSLAIAVVCLASGIFVIFLVKRRNKKEKK